MKMPSFLTEGQARPAAGPRERGSVVLVVLLLLAIVFIYLTANVRTLHYLNRDLQLIERQQVRRLAGPPKTGRPKLEAGARKAEPAGREAGKAGK
jgi:hypothetical protein